MPRVNIYVRKDDLENWNMIDDKPAWLHFHLHKGVKVITNYPDGSGKIEDLTQEPKKPSKNLASSMEPYLRKKKQEFEVAINPDRLSNGVCKIHGTPLDSRGKCLQKGCKYA